MGWVGASVAISTLQAGICKELLLNDVKKEIAEGEAMDLNHGSPFFSSATVRASSISEMKNCDAVVITAGRGGRPNETRLDLLKDNVQIAKSISVQLEGFKGILIIVANPVDVLTYFYQKFTGLPKHKVIGTGTMLDTARLRQMISAQIGVDPKSIHASVIGEHGDSELVLWSKATISGVPLRQWKGWKSEYEKEISEKVRTAAYEIIQRKGATNHAIGLVSATLLKWLLRGDQRICNVSSVIDGAYGLSDLAISIPSQINQEGIQSLIEMELSQLEKDLLLKSAGVIQEAIKSVS